MPSSRLLRGLQLLSLSLALTFVPSLRTGRPKPNVQHHAALWDQFLPKDPVDVPLNASALSNRLQDVIFTVVEKGLPQVDIDLPPGLILGVEGEEPDELEPKKCSKEEEFQGDRELAGGLVQFFYEFKNTVNLCVLFRNRAMATIARGTWGDFGKARVVGFPPARQMEIEGDSVLSLAQLLRNRPFVAAVAPRARQLKALQELSEAKDVKMLLILLNARVRCRSEDCTDIRKDVAFASNPVFHVSFAGPKGEGLLYKSINTPWVLVRREDGKELWRGDDEPTKEVVRNAMKES